MSPFGPVADCIQALQDPINQLHYNRRQCQQLVDHSDQIQAFIASLEEKSYMPVQDLLDLQQKLSEALTDLYDVLTDIRRQPHLKQILWRDGISILVSQVYEILSAASESFNMAEMDLILKKNKEARNLDVDNFHDIIRTVKDDQILKMLGVSRNQLSQAIIALHQRIKTILNDSNLERQFLNRGLCAMQTLKAESIPAPQDAFPMTDFDIVIYHNRELGRGGFGEVFEGNWHGTKVAIKRIRSLHPALSANEINIMKRLKHDHVLQIFGANLNTNQLFLVCALKSQGDVCMFLHNNSIANRRKLCYDVSLGLSYLHENLVIHGDIKPNILIDENGIPCLCDFGLSRIRTLFTHSPTTPLDDEGPPFGTLQYMSPEQMMYGTTNEGSDVYSFGMTMYEIFSGDIPFKDISCWSSLRNNVVKFANRPAKPQPHTGHGFDDKLWSLIEECWSQEPSNRPTAATVSLRLGDDSGFSANPAEMYKKEIADLTAELARVKERSKAARQEFEKELAMLRDSLERREREQAKLKKELDEERDLRKRLEKNSEEPSAQVLQSLSKKVDLTERQDDVVIAVVGVTGTGKSSVRPTFANFAETYFQECPFQFIKLLTGDTSIKISTSFLSETSDVQIFHFHDPDSGRKVTFVDTPGFGFNASPNLDDTDILKRIADFLLREYDQKRKLSGLIYFQRVSDNRFGVESGRYLRTFQELCGPQAYKNVVVLTTFWDEVSIYEGAEREVQLKSEVFSQLVEGGAQFMRHHHTVESARKVLRHILPMPPTIVQIQTEMGINGLSLIETAVGSGHSRELKKNLAKYKKDSELADLSAKQEFERKRAKLEREHAKLKKGLDDERGQPEPKKGSWRQLFGP